MSVGAHFTHAWQVAVPVGYACTTQASMAAVSQVHSSAGLSQLSRGKSWDCCVEQAASASVVVPQLDGGPRLGCLHL
jgi:hypothetical protein